MENSSDYDSESEVPPGQAGSDGYKPGYEVPLLTVVCLLGFTGNFMVWMVYSKPKYRKSNAAIYILSLAAGDILALVVVIFHITEFFPVTWSVLWAHDWQCALHRFFRFVGFNNTVLTMTAIAVDRYYAVRHPVAFKIRFTVKRTRIVVCGLWLLTLVVSAPFAFMFRSISRGGGGAQTYPGKLSFACKLVLSSYGDWFVTFKPIYLNGVLFYLPVVVTATLYVIIVLHVWRNNKFVSSQMGRSPYRNSHWKTAKTLLTVFVVYVACYILFVSYNLLAPFAPGLLSPQIKNVGLLLPYVNSCMNPMVYSFTNASFRKTCWETFCCEALVARCCSGANDKVRSGKESETCSSVAERIKADRPPMPTQIRVAVIPADSLLSVDKASQTGDIRMHDTKADYLAGQELATNI
ncbi:somatostatin receptor type 4-like [Patiria miniata]|uniref:G-protein coupled receptors family 1 profile domain-containing protein n=1 Tax=Patiria miniata TaxID=46514 RepID=A0A914BL96_PATMI|nr:somatostatin receptor type 4-like [Patiria miniata]